MSAKNKRIALISVHGDPAVEIGKEEAGGQNVYVRSVGEALSKQGWQVDMFTRKADASQPAIVEHNSLCRTIRLKAGPEEFIPRDNIFSFAPRFVSEFLKFQDVTGVKYPIVHTNYWISSWVGMQLKKCQGIKLVHTYHSLGAIKYQSLSTIPMIAKTRLFFEKAVLETADCVVATSPQERNHLQDLVSTKGYVDIIPCGTDIRNFGSIPREKARQILKIAADEKVVLFVGRFDPRKGIETLVRAVAACKIRQQAKLKLIIGGGWREGESDGFERERIDGIVKDLGLGEITIFPGRLGREDLPVYYAAADVCVVPSYYEPFGLVTIEAMACGTPVIGSDVGGLQYTIIPEKTGLLCPPKNEMAFADALDRILSNPDFAKELGQKARLRVETKFSWDGVAKQLNDLYCQILEKPVEEMGPVSA